MKTKPFLVQIRPRAFARWRALPIFGALLEDFGQWMADQGYAVQSIGSYQNQFKGLARKAPLHLNAETGGSQAYER